MAEHTPDPKPQWRVGTMTMTKRDWARLHGDQLTIVQDGPDVVAAVWADKTEDEEQYARLIAAAPDLLEALRTVVRVADRQTAEFDLARAAIRKAETGQP